MQSRLENCLKLKPANSHFWNEDDGRNSIYHRQSIQRVCDPRTGTERILSASCLGHKVSATFITGWSTNRSFCWFSTNQIKPLEDVQFDCILRNQIWHIHQMLSFPFITQAYCREADQGVQRNWPCPGSPSSGWALWRRRCLYWLGLKFVEA